MLFRSFELVTRASIVEREAKVDSERATIAGVINNRLKAEMPLHAVVLDGVGRAHDLDVLKPFDTAVEGILHILRQAAGSTLQIHLFGVLAAGLHKDGVYIIPP